MDCEKCRGKKSIMETLNICQICCHNFNEILITPPVLYNEEPKAPIKKSFFSRKK